MTGSAAMVAPRPSIGTPQRGVVTAAVAFAFALWLLPGPRADNGEVAAAVGLGLAAIGLSGLWQRFPVPTRMGVVTAYVGMVALLIDGGGGTSSGFGGLFLLPLLWLAVVGSRAELVAGFAVVAIARILPVKLLGSPLYPSGTWRTAVVFGAVAVISCTTVQQLVRVARLRANELHDRAAELEDAARRLEAQNDQLRQLDQAKDGFVALVSHELRTPLTSIAGFLEILLEDGEALTAEQQRFLSTVSRNVSRLTTLVNELLFLAQVDAGRFELQLGETDIRQLLAEATEAARPAAAAKNIQLTLEAEELAAAYCDRAQMAQLVDNLLSNALKFTPEGGRVAVRADRNGDAIALSVSDTGIGIPADELPRLFGRFFRASTATSEGIPGTGLGLAISQAIAEAHDSTITVRSTPSHGTTFRLLLASAH